MGLAEHTSRIVSEFDFSDEELNRHVQEFLEQTGTFATAANGIALEPCLAAASLPTARIHY